MIISTEGIVLRKVKYGETSLIVDIYTRSEGMMTCIVSGVRKQKPKLSAALFELMSCIEFVVYVKPNRGVQRLTEARTIHLYKQLPFDPVRSAVGQFAVELIRNAIREPEQNEELYDFLEQYFLILDTTENTLANFPILLCLELSRYLGFYPDRSREWKEQHFDMRAGSFEPDEIVDQKYILSLQGSKDLHELLGMDWRKGRNHRLSSARRKYLLDKLLQYYFIHIEHFKPMRSVDVLSALFY